MVSPWWNDEVQQQSKPFQASLEPTLYYVEGFSVLQQRQSNILPESLAQQVHSLGQGWERQSNILHSNILPDAKIIHQETLSVQSQSFEPETISFVEKNSDVNTVNSISRQNKISQKSDFDAEILKSSSLDLTETLATFNQDIDALLGEKKKKEITQHQMKTQHENPGELSASASAHPNHDIFDQMSSSMRYANTFNFGDVDLSDRFNDFDKSLDIETSFATKVPEFIKDFSFDELELDELDLVHELATIDEM